MGIYMTTGMFWIVMFFSLVGISSISYWILDKLFRRKYGS